MGCRLKGAFHRFYHANKIVNIIMQLFYGDIVNYAQHQYLPPFNWEISQYKRK